ncbi:SGNH/GDSL hydrolase family protein [Bradyrhizobium sp. ISRA443]|uniref:SGNH/GDSL hydrolase family protein n=1 Tax=unclassified Bradyrhizobium TaxID=2631580 RepID=UPI00247AD9EC|nr:MULTISPECIES: SGNH/GDSL hydrolase family protein [unclassified Bradyrhizobium]WGR92356.1 SGNH/GDSL hydrolase family protein [Bradyrhizobium sp. ISRA435]WGR96694.1 SGNH/GDSL hydrolase family protein [Bradyrhizobium sp. ISRA436]WGS03581.1 SGNH/GDSL hydrolase family protein [Bradyrhizobium sp. ISRA437]WGS10465.1 SGNH/GDSL hydrolase family protein [Bradyrhizobium sp. ISRA443]
MPGPRPCETHPDIVKLDHRLPHFADALKRQRKVKVVALGSSSTAGADGVLPFPPRLEMLLRQRFFGRMIDVINRGIGGQEAPEEFSRIESDVVAETPVLVIWQVGTNAVYKSYNPAEVKASLEAGLDVLAALPLDVMVMDSQYTEAIIGTPDALKLANTIMPMIAEVTASKQINLFRRFALMKRWVDDGIPLAELDDGAQEHLHTSEWATNCVTQALFGAIDQALAPEAIS